MKMPHVQSRLVHWNVFSEFFSGSKQIDISEQIGNHERGTFITDR